MKFSANLGLLWKELSLSDAIRAAKKAGFDAVECHWPYDTPTNVVNDVLAETGLVMLGLNTSPGDLAKGEFGLAALSGREVDARAAIDQALDYAVSINAPNVHVMAGFASGKKAHDTFVNNLRYAVDKAAELGITILIEPLNHCDAPGYFLQNSSQAQAIIKAIAADNLKLMFDCYHVQIMEGDISRRLQNLLPIIGHIQFASVPERAEPDRGELNYHYVFDVLREIGYDQPLGAEYKPASTTEAGLGWLSHLSCPEK